MKTYKLIIDHSGGGGANIFKSNFINKVGIKDYALLTEVNSVTKLIIYFNNTKKIVDFQNNNDLINFFKSFYITDIYFNNVVTFKNPILIIDILMSVINKYKPNIIFFAHDFFSICPSYALIDYKNKFCDIPNIQQCEICLKNNNNPTIPGTQSKMYNFIDITYWRSKWISFLNSCNEIRCFSESSKILFLKAYPDLKNITVLPHELMLNRNTFKLDSYRFLDPFLHIGIVGNLDIVHKGSIIIKDIIIYLNENNINYKLTIIGSFPTLDKSNLINITGEYHIENLPNIVNNSGINVFLMPSVCSETFSYVTHELISLDLDICSFNLGGQAEVIKKHKKGHIISEISASAAVTKMLEVFDSVNGKN